MPRNHFFRTFRRIFLGRPGRGFRMIQRMLSWRWSCVLSCCRLAPGGAAQAGRHISRIRLHIGHDRRVLLERETAGSEGDAAQIHQPPRAQPGHLGPGRRRARGNRAGVLGRTSRDVRAEGPGEWRRVRRDSPNPRHAHRSALLPPDAAWNRSGPGPAGILEAGPERLRIHCGPQVCHSIDWAIYKVYSFTVRIYYNSSKAASHGRIVSTGRRHDRRHARDRSRSAGLAGRAGKDRVHSGPVRKVEFVGLYEDFNWEGDGVFRQWHYQTEQGVLRRHIGTAVDKPYRVTWDNRWVPDQDQPVQLRRGSRTCTA